MEAYSRASARRRAGSLCTVILWTAFVFCFLQLSGVDAAAKKCNQHEELCSRAYNDVSYISTHASFAVTSQENPTKPGTQFKGIKDQLDYGVRGLHFNIMQGTTASEVVLCYPDCTVNNGGTLLDSLKIVKTWMDANTNDVVTIFLEGVDTDASPAAVVKAFGDAGIDKYALKGKPESWPTLEKMIDAGTTLVVFAEDSNIAAANSQGYFIPYQGIVFKLDGPFNYGDEWTCGPWERSTHSIMLIPHFIIQTASYNGVTYNNLPYPFNLGTTNGYQYESHAVTCRSGQSIWVNFMEVDFYDQGDVLTPTLKLNSLPYKDDNFKYFYPEFFDADPNLPSSLASRFIPEPWHITMAFGLLLIVNML
ncbi:hypothetical protein LPJ55_000501 [Coemansia sp. RSA 990]|nr:PLC-like phosphodiesterase [Coemansia mojavensis]KAJ1875689.1 hypothetical protein LPJ55_000501 [Coemansia sp. RSA 990]KAJ2673874.1 hypothetical protein IWW42_002004 [Coemansia sp. RSA 1085]